MRKSEKEMMTRVLEENEIKGVWDANQRAEFSLDDVPQNLRLLVPYAHIWGLVDDSQRRAVLENTPELLRCNLKWVIDHFDEQLDEWLAGPKAANGNPSDAYIAFSAMRMAADSI
jgi:hypothetical protein